MRKEEGETSPKGSELPQTNSEVDPIAGDWVERFGFRAVKKALSSAENGTAAQVAEPLESFLWYVRARPEFSTMDMGGAFTEAFNEANRIIFGKNWADKPLVSYNREPTASRAEYIKSLSGLHERGILDDTQFKAVLRRLITMPE